ncbi:flavin reductase (DIM6/NTAB) family NADH-FMN oxidoreductase RutF [Nitrobacteraceae bacterium AZCC 2161]
MRNVSSAIATATPIPPPVLAVDEEAALRQAFTHSMRHVPGAVAIVATEFEGERRGLAVTAWCSLSTEPPSVLVCVNKNASAHDSIVRSGIFSINQLAAEHTEIVAVFSNQRGLQGDARFGEGGWEAGPTGVPMLSTAIVSMECRVSEHHDHGTHSVFIGTVLGLRVPAEGEPLVYLKSRYARPAPLG